MMFDVCRARRCPRPAFGHAEPGPAPDFLLRLPRCREVSADRRHGPQRTLQSQTSLRCYRVEIFGLYSPNSTAISLPLGPQGSYYSGSRPVDDAISVVALLDSLLD